MDVIDVPVLVVGAGPAGLAAGVTLARHGVPVMLAERRPGPSGLPRATTISTRTMEILRSWGIEDAVRAGGVEVEWLMWSCETLAAAGAGTAIEVGLPTRAQARLISPSTPGCAPQGHLERVMLDHLAAQPGADVRLSTELVGLSDRRDGVLATLRDAAGGEVLVHARYLVAADGAHSAVRARLGIPTDGSDDMLAGVTALAEAPLWHLLGPHRYGIYLVVHDDVETIVLPAGPGDQWGFGYLVTPGEEDGPLPRADGLAARLRAAAGVPDLPVAMGRIGAFTSAARIARRFREGDAFLVGDAAHRVTPRGGTGMNTALHDGVDLGWKLAWTLRGWATEGLLDTYEAERRPVAAHNVARSADPEGSRRSAGEELRADLGARIAHHWVDTPAGRVSTLDLLGPGLTLFTGPDGTGWGGAGRGGEAAPPVLHRRLDMLTARALGIRAGGALLVRPDGVPYALWPEGPHAAARPPSLAVGR